MEINSARVFGKCFLPYAIVGGLSMLAASIINFSVSNIWNGLMKGIIFALLFMLTTWCIIPKDEKKYLLELAKGKR